MTEYYIVKGNAHEGPFDLVSAVRKIRNGKITRDTMLVASLDEPGRPAFQFSEFLEIFEEVEDGAPKTSTQRFAKLNFVSLLKDGGDFFKQNPLASVVTGIFMSLAIGGVLLSEKLLSGPAHTVFGIVWSYFLFTIYQISVLRKVRMQILSVGFLQMVMRQSFRALLFCAVFISLPVFIVPSLLAEIMGRPEMLALALVPGTFILMWFFFAPLLIADRNIGALQAMGLSLRLVWRMGMDNFGVLYLLLMANFIFGVVVLPLLFTLPVTLAAMSEVYDEFFNEF